jgi:hypothetical protein
VDEVVDIYNIKGQLPKIFENDVKMLCICKSSNYAVYGLHEAE